MARHRFPFLLFFSLAAGMAIIPIHAAGQSTAIDLMPPLKGSEEMSGQGGWNKRLLGSPNKGIEEAQWMVKISSAGVEFEADTSLAGQVTVRREGLGNCKKVVGSLAVDGNHPRVQISDGTSRSIELRRSAVFQLDVESDLPRDSLLLFFHVFGNGKVWGSISGLKASDCQ